MLTPAHFHLMIVHFPVIGSILGLTLYAFALRSGSQDLRKASLMLFVFLAVTSAFSFLSGLGAEELVEDLMGVSEPAIESHEHMALAAMILMVTTGVLSLLQLVWSRFGTSTRTLLSRLTLLSALAAVILMGITANRGGKIRHSELRPGVSMPATLESDDD
jgi:uncharacterized membrane protein